MALALEYRWKGMEAGCAYYYRCHLQHGLGVRMCERCSGPKLLAAAEAELANNANVDRDMTAAKQRVKLGHVVRFSSTIREASRASKRWFSECRACIL